MRDGDIRRSLHTMLWNQHGLDGDTVIRHELGLCAGSRRVDIALVNGELTGFEIKSDEDTLSRLAGQANVYCRVFDKVVIVTGEKHLEGAMSQLPGWWGVMVATQSDGAARLATVRAPQRNERVDPFSLVQLLWRDEALEELRLRGLGGGLGKKARHYLWNSLAGAVEVDELRATVRSRIKARRDW